MIDAAPGCVLRSWTGWISPEDRDAYRDYVEATGLSQYRETAGNLGAIIVFRDLDDGRCEVRTLSWWRSRADIVGFAGDDISAARFYPDDDRYLIDRDWTVQHFDVA